MEMLAPIFEMSPLKKLGVLLVSCLAVLGFYWMSFLTPVKEEVVEMQGVVDQARSEVAKLKGVAGNLESFEKEIERLDGELKKALQELPDKKAIALLLSRIADRAKDSGLDVPLFKPVGEAKKDFYAEVPVEMTVRGTYHQVATFFDEVGRLDRIVNLGSVKMETPEIDGDRVVLTSSVVATAFRFLEESERPKPKKEERKRKKKK